RAVGASGTCEPTRAAEPARTTEPAWTAWTAAGNVRLRARRLRVDGGARILRGSPRAATGRDKQSDRGHDERRGWSRQLQHASSTSGRYGQAPPVARVGEEIRQIAPAGSPYSPQFVRSLSGTPADAQGGCQEMAAPA